MKNSSELCPFSKPILGKWCVCPYAKIAELCSGKMTCTRAGDLQQSCLELDSKIKVNTRFILGMKSDADELTHAKLMKIRCGSLLGMQRVLAMDTLQPVNIRNVIDKITNEYGSLDAFPYNEIVQDIQHFKHR
jgi:hypothetical protein